MQGLPFVYALVVTLAGPALLSRGCWRLRRPRTALALWLGAFATSAISIVVGLVLFVRVAVVPGSEHSAASRTVSFVAAWLVIAMLGALGAVTATQLLPLELAQRRMRRRTVDLVAEAASGRGRIGGIPVVVVDTDASIALCVPGRARQIVVSSRLKADLSAGELRSVIEHERTHLVQRHDLITRLAHLLSTALPLVPGSRGLERATGLLLELIADDAAARVCGTGVAAEALEAVERISGDVALGLRADRLRSRPLERAGRPARSRATAAVLDLDR